ncbi:MAG TPA: ABC transporter substrate-binding protein [Alphaproteobacteria bacterium]|nr:ABC transporter substrate-binding protein [Alphaproteobacteria bacterium]
MRQCKGSVSLFSLIIVLGFWAATAAIGEEQPRYGGILRVALPADPPSLDMHQESTFAVAQPMGAVYNNLVVFDPHNYPQIIGDLAQSWTVSDDFLTYTFTLHQGVKFHDGSELTSADVKVSWDRILFPSEGVVSIRRSNYPMIKSVEAPEPYTVVFRLHHPSPSFLASIAHPANFIFAKKYLDQDPHYYKTHAVGTGPFKLKNYVRGSYIELERNPDYWKKGLPYLDGITYFIIKDTSARAKALRSGRVDVELRFLPPSEVDAIKEQLGDKIVVAKVQNIGNFGVIFNVDKKPFDDERVRKAMTLAIDRYDMVKTLAPITNLETVGGLSHPLTQWALSQEELEQLPGFGRDHQANLREAKRLMAEAGYPNGFKTVLTNRNIKMPYIDFGVYLISSWKKIGVEAEHKLEETATWSQSRVSRDFELMVDPYGSATVGDPDEMLDRFVTGGSENYGRFSDPVADALFQQQAREMDEQKRIQLVKEMDKRILEKVWRIQGLWTTRLEVRSAKIRNYEPQPSHWMNRRFEDVWLAER